MPSPKDTEPIGSNFASRRADREAREAAGEEPEPFRPRTFRAGTDAENPLLVITHVQA